MKNIDAKATKPKSNEPVTVNVKVSKPEKEPVKACVTVTPPEKAVYRARVVECEQ